MALKMNYNFPKIGVINDAYIKIASFKSYDDFSDVLTVKLAVYFSDVKRQESVYNYIDMINVDLVAPFPADNTKNAIYKALKDFIQFHKAIDA
jgi:hypothetical protein